MYEDVDEFLFHNEFLSSPITNNEGDNNNYNYEIKLPQNDRFTDFSETLFDLDKSNLTSCLELNLIKPIKNKKKIPISKNKPIKKIPMVFQPFSTFDSVELTVQSLKVVFPFQKKY